MKGGPFGEKNFSKKKSRSAEKNERGDPLVSPGMVCYAEKQEKTFWFSSLGQIMQCGFSTSILLQNIKKLKGEKFSFSEKNLTVPKKTVRGDPLGFSNVHSDAKQQKN